MSGSEMTSGSQGDSPEAGGARERLRERAEELVEDVRQVGRSAKGLAQDAIDEAVNAGEEVRDRGVARAGEFEDQIVEYVRAKPIQSVLMAAAAGFVLSSIVRR
jgi:ElaB/YqjD/DUF883 family membrane-anchored ribosome-binding protein